MHSYQHNIKTFNSATRHLTRVERALYRDLIELYYDTESPLTSDMERLCRLVIANTDEEKAALIYVLAEFFELTGLVYTHDYCDEQIAKYKCSLTAKSAAGIASANAKKQRAAARKADRSTQSQQNSTPVQQTCNEIQLTSNQEPVTSNQISIAPQPSNAVAIAPAKQTKSTRLSAEWQLPKALGEWAVDQGLTVNEVHAEADKFRDYWIAKSGKDATKNDWPATWRNWIRNRKTPSAEQKTFYEKTREAKERDADKRLTGLASCSMGELEALGLARDGVMLGARA